MNYYVVNKSRGITTYFNGTVALQPKGKPRHARRLPGFARQHPDIQELEDKGVIDVLTEAQYREYLDSIGQPAPVPEPEAEAEEPEAEAEEPEAEAEEPEAEAPMSMDDFLGLKADEQKAKLTELGVEGDAGNATKREALYQGYLDSLN